MAFLSPALRLNPISFLFALRDLGQCLLNPFREKRNLFIEDGSHIEKEFILTDSTNHWRLGLSQISFEAVHGKVEGFKGKDDRSKILKGKGSTADLGDILPQSEL